MIINCIFLIIVSVNTISGGVIKESSKSIFTGRELKQICKSIQSNVNSGIDPVKSQADVFNEYSSKLGSTSDSSDKLKKLEADQNAIKFKRLLKAFTQLIGTVDRLNNGLQVKQEDETSTVNEGESNFQDGNSEVDDQVKPSDGDNENGNDGNEVDIDDNDHDDHDDDDDDDEEGDENYSNEFDICEFIDYPDEIDLSEVEYGDLDSVDYDIYEYDFEPFGLSLNLHLAVSH